MTTACVDFGLALRERLVADPVFSMFFRYNDENGEHAYRIHRNHVPDWGEEGERWSEAYADAAAQGQCLDLALPAIPSWCWFQLRDVEELGCINGRGLPEYVHFDIELVTQDVEELEAIACAFGGAIELPSIQPERFGNVLVDETIVSGVSDSYEPKSMRGADWGFHWRALDFQLMPIAIIEES